MSVPMPYSEVTLAVRDMPRMRSFFEALGWSVRSSVGNWCRFEAQGSVLALFGLEEFAQERFDLPPLAPDGTFRGFSVACVALSPAAVDEAYSAVEGRFDIAD